MNIQHGGNLDQAKKLFPEVTGSWLDLSTGINPYSYPFSSLDISLYEKLPSYSHEENLRQVAADYYGCKNKSCVALAPGTQILISLMPTVLNAKEVYVLYPTYEEYISSWWQAGVKVTRVVNFEDFETLCLQKNVVGVICNPNNPDGRKIDIARLESLIKKWSVSGNHLILDEAYMDFSGQSMAYLLPSPGLLVLRSFGKTFGLAGLRVGFLLASPEIVQRIRYMLGLWPVNGPALQIAAEALQDGLWKIETEKKLRIQQKRLDAFLQSHSFNLVGGTLLFRLFYHRSANDIWKHLASHGIWVRKFDYNPNWLRFGLLYRQADWQRLEAVLLSIS